MIYINGEFVPPAQTRIAINDRGLTLGDGVFETIRIRDGVIQRLDDHWERLERSCRTIGMELPISTRRLTENLKTLLRLNRAFDAIVRLTLTRGPAVRGLLPKPPAQCKPTLMMVAFPASEDSFGPTKAIVASVTRRNEYSPLSRIKSTNYLDNILARREADEKGASEAILLNTQNRVADTTTANIFVVEKGVLVTPPAEDGALEGVLRKSILSGNFELKAKERPLTVNDLLAAEEIILTNAAGVRAITELNGKPVGDGIPGPVWEKLAIAEGFIIPEEDTQTNA